MAHNVIGLAILLGIGVLILVGMRSQRKSNTFDTSRSGLFMRRNWEKTVAQSYDVETGRPHNLSRTAMFGVGLFALVFIVLGVALVYVGYVFLGVGITAYAAALFFPYAYLLTAALISGSNTQNAHNVFSARQRAYLGWGVIVPASILLIIGVVFDAPDLANTPPENQTWLTFGVRLILALLFFASFNVVGLWRAARKVT